MNIFVVTITIKDRKIDSKAFHKLLDAKQWLEDNCRLHYIEKQLPRPAFGYTSPRDDLLQYWDKYLHIAAGYIQECELV